MNARRLGIAAVMVLASNLLWAQQFEFNRGITGSWYNAAQSGHGLSIEVLDDSSVLVFWYMFTPQGDSAFLVGIGERQGNVVTAPMTYADGMAFGEFDPDTVTRDEWGEVSITFQSCTQATLTYTSSFTVDGQAFGSGTIPIERLAFIQDLECDIAELGRGLPRSPAAGLYVGLTNDQVNAEESFAIAVIDESSRVWVLVPPEGIIFGQLNLTGATVAATLTEQDVGESTGGPVAVSADVFRRDGLNGTFNTDDSGGVFTFKYDSIYERDTSVADYAGSWTYSGDGITLNLTIDNQGIVSGSDNFGCAYSGTLSPLEAGFSPVEISGQLSGCGFAGNLEGVLALGDREAIGDNGRLVIGARTPASAVVFELHKAD